MGDRGGDVGDVMERVEAHLRAVDAATKVTAFELLSGGACQENYRVEVETTSGPRVFVLRSDAKTSLPGSIDREREARVVSIACQHGVKTPEPRWFSKGLVREGAGAYFLDFVPGEAIGRKVVASAELTTARTKLPEQLAVELAKIHRVVPRDVPDLFGAAAPTDGLGPRLDQMRASIAAFRQPRPAIEFAFRWLREQRVAEGEVTLVHGDFRTGNFLVSERGLEAILDWEFASWGAPTFDLAWIATRDWRFNKRDLPIGGFATREVFYAAYERASGRKLDPVKLHYWEVLCNVGWAIGSVAQGERFVYGGEPDIELLAVGRRACEMEFEALRLIERGTL